MTQSMNPAENDDVYKYKIILLGAVGVGKTAIFNRLRTGRFISGARLTQGVDAYTFKTTVGKDRINVSIVYYIVYCKLSSLSLA